MHLCWLILLLLACNKRQEPGPAAEGSGSAHLAAPMRGGYYDEPAGNAESAGSAPLDAGSAAADGGPAGPAPIDPDRLLDAEALGPLRFGMAQKDVLKLLGQPVEKPIPSEEGATGQYVSNWSWESVQLEMVSDTRQGAAKVRLITVKSADYPTKRGIKIGSSLAQVAAAYPKSDEGSDDPTQFLVGSPYGGLLFILHKDAVAEILLGPLAF